MNDLVLFDIFPVRRVKTPGVEDYRFVCFPPGIDYETRMSVLEETYDECYLAMMDDAFEVIGFHRKNGQLVTKDPKHLGKTGEILHYCTEILHQDNEFIERTLKAAEYFDKRNEYFDLVSAVSKIGLKILYRRRKGHVFNEMQFTEDQLNKYGQDNVEILKTYKLLRENVFKDDDEEELFLHFYVTVGLSMENLVVLPQYHFEN